MRIIAAAFAVLLTAGMAAAQPATRTATAPTAAANTSQFTTEADAKAHCGSDMVVWMNSRSRVYHFAGVRDYGHTKQGAYMCRAEADKMGRAAKNEKAPAG